MDLRKFFFSPPPNKWRVFKGNVISGFAGRICLFYWALWNNYFFI